MPKYTVLISYEYQVEAKSHEEARLMAVMRHAEHRDEPYIEVNAEEVTS